MKSTDAAKNIQQVQKLTKTSLLCINSFDILIVFEEFILICLLHDRHFRRFCLAIPVFVEM